VSSELKKAMDGNMFCVLYNILFTRSHYPPAPFKLKLNTINYSGLHNQGDTVPKYDVGSWVESWNGK
jgi:hypothetical protein